MTTLLVWPATWLQMCFFTLGKGIGDEKSRLHPSQDKILRTIGCSLDDGELWDLVLVHEAVQLGGEHGETVAVLAVIQQQAEPGGGIQ